jgi:hypothetical protein
VISQCAALDLVGLYAYKDSDGNFSAFQAVKAEDGTFRLPKEPIPLPPGIPESKIIESLKMMMPALKQQHPGAKLQLFTSPALFLRFEDAPAYKEPPTQIRLPQVVLPLPIPGYAVFSEEDKKIIKTLPVARSEAKEQSATKPSAVGSELIVLPVKEDSNGKVTAFIAEPAEDGKLNLSTHRERLPLSAMSDNDKDALAKILLNVIEKENPKTHKVKYEFVRNGQFRIIKIVCNEQFENVEEPFRVIPYPIPNDIKLSEEDMAIIKALHPSPPYLLYAGIGAAVVVVLIVAFFVFRHFRNKNKQSSPF